jgi:hypothetical protein
VRTVVKTSVDAATQTLESVTTGVDAVNVAAMMDVVTIVGGM